MNSANQDKIRDLINKFNTTPVLFIGSGFSRRYYGLPAWADLLKFFATRLSNDEFGYESYYNKAASTPDTSANYSILANVASLIQLDYDNEWFSNKKFRDFNEQELEAVHEGVSPFKIAVAKYIGSKAQIDPEREEEVHLFNEISRKSISGIITTNYDTLIESITDSYKIYIGQEELIFSAIQGYGEIYKIHGSITDPSSIVITSEDYKNFVDKSAYLAAKLMTIFMEYPIVFIGYSITDPNIKLILNSLGKCLSSENLQRLQDRFIYIEHDKTNMDFNIYNLRIPVGENTINMTGIKTDNFLDLYKYIGMKRATFPVKMIRMFKEELYTYTLTNRPTEHLFVASLDDERVDDERLVLAIAKPSEIAINGLKGITAEQWYRNIILSDLNFSSDDLLEYAYPQLISTQNKLPLNKLLHESEKQNSKNYNNKVTKFDDALTETIFRNRDRERNKIRVKSVDWILDNYKTDLKKAMQMIAYLYEDEINIDSLEKFLIERFSEKDFYKSLDNKKSYIHRLVFIYDYLKYGKSPA